MHFTVLLILRVVYLHTTSPLYELSARSVNYAHLGTIVKLKLKRLVMSSDVGQADLQGKTAYPTAL